jgi:hypothetical protein
MITPEEKPPAFSFELKIIDARGQVNTDAC